MEAITLTNNKITSKANSGQKKFFQALKIETELILTAFINKLTMKLAKMLEIFIPTEGDS